MNNKKINTSKEIERKYLIEMPDTGLLESLEGATITQITQTYLTIKNFAVRRVRKSVRGGVTRYIYNEKTPLSHLTRIEREAEITEAGYIELLKEADPSLSTIIKTRYAVPFMGYVYEIDIFDFSVSKAIMEVELPNSRGIPPLPYFVKVIREVTKEKGYTNYEIAKSIPAELTL
jgi:CYTH domain-containing protein